MITIEVVEVDYETGWNEGRYSGRSTFFEDKFGRLLQKDEIDELSPWEIEELGIHVSPI
jgi:hypothetical protein